MIRAILIVALAYSANAGLTTLVGGPAISYAAGPALGAPLVGKVSYNPAEVTVVKQPITVDQPEIRYRSVPTVVGYSVPQVVAQPQVRLVAQPQVLSVAQPQVRLVSQPQVLSVAQPQVRLVSQPQVLSVAQPQVLSVAQPQVRLVSQPQVLTTTHAVALQSGLPLAQNFVL